MNATTAYALAALMFILAAVNGTSGTATSGATMTFNVITAVLFLAIGRRVSARTHTA